jgi:hypothetical protein
MLIKAHDKKILSDDKGEDADLFACSNPYSPPSSSAPNPQYKSPNPQATPSAAAPVPPPPPQHPHQHASPSPNLSHKEVDQAFKAVANELNRRNLDSQRLSRELDIIMERLNQVEASSPSPSCHHRVSSTNSNQVLPHETSSNNIPEPN